MQLEFCAFAVCVEESTLTLQSFWTMYGPVNVTYWPYVDGLWASYFFAYSSGTGALTGSDSAWITGTDEERVSLMTSVWSSGVVIPEMFGAVVLSFLTACSACSNPTSRRGRRACSRSARPAAAIARSRT